VKSLLASQAGKKRCNRRVIKGGKGGKRVPILRDIKGKTDRKGSKQLMSYLKRKEVTMQQDKKL